MTGPADPDRQLLRSATRRMAWQLAAASAVVVVLAALATLALSPVLGHGRGGHEGGPDRDDDILRTTLLVAGTIGVAIAGLAGLFIARRAEEQAGSPLPRWFTLTVTLLTPMAFAAAWEICEFASDIIIGTTSQHGLSDSMTDIVAGTLGGVFAIVLLLLTRRPRSLAPASLLDRS